MAQAVGDLLGNAAKFTQPGGRVDVIVEVNPELRKAVARVRDTGAGIAPEMLSRIFEPFTQAEDTLARSKGGLGLGLALVKGILELHGGTVSAESDGIGKGAAFGICFPLEPGSPPPTRPVASAASRVLARILVIEDNVDAAETLRTVMRLEGSTPEVAFTGAEGIEKARVFGPDAIFCDIGLPDMNGYDVARALRADPTLKSVVLVALTGYAAPEDVARSREAGFDHHLAKPPAPEQISRLLVGLAPRAPDPSDPTGEPTRPAT